MASSGNFPEIVCLCGSTRFVAEFDREMLRLTEEGCIVLTIGTHRASAARLRADNHFGNKKELDELHLRKIDLADRVLVLNVTGYVGNSTRAEIEYAGLAGKRVEFLETPHAP